MTLKHLFEQHYSELYRFCFLKLNNSQDAEDIVMEVFSKIASKDLSTIHNKRAYLFKSCHNLIINKFYANSKPVINESEFSYDIELSDESIKVEDQAFDYYLSSQILNALEQLDDVKRSVITLKLIEEFKFKEIAEILDKKESFVKFKFYEGINDLKKILEEKDYGRVRVITLPVIYFIVSRVKYAIMINMPSVKFGTGLGAAVGVDSITKSQPGLLLQLLIGSSAMATMGLAGAAGYYIFEPPREPELRDESSFVETVRADVVVEEEKENVQVYRHERFPDFSFEYDADEWRVEESFNLTKGSNNGSFLLNINLTNAISSEQSLYFSLEGGYGIGESTSPICFNQNEATIDKIVSNIYRISEITKDIAGGKSFYDDGVYFKDTEEFSEISNYISEFQKQTTIDYCLAGVIGIYTSTYIKLGDIVDAAANNLDPQMDLPVVLDIYTDTNDLKALENFDQIIRTLSY